MDDRPFLSIDGGDKSTSCTFKRAFFWTLLGVVLIGIGVIIGYFSHPSSSSSSSPSSPSIPSTVTLGSLRHIVIFRFNPTTTPQNVSIITQRFNALKSECVNPNTGVNYLGPMEQGVAQSTLNLDQNFTHGWVWSFANEIDRDYYVGRPFQTHYDPHHDAFKALVGPFLYSSPLPPLLPTINPGVLVYDFTVLVQHFQSSSSSSSLYVTPTVGMIRQVILMRFNATAQQNPSQRATIVSAFEQLFTSCVDPKNHAPYLLSLEGGYPNSHEGVDQSFEYGWTLLFANDNDRQYFNTADPASQAFFQMALPWLDVNPLTKQMNGLFVFEMPLVVAQ